MSSNGVTYETASKDFCTQRREQLVGLAGVTEANLSATILYKVPFQQALSLLAGRSVYLEAGFAYVPFQRLVSIIITRFRTLLSRALVEASTYFGHISGDSRIAPLLKNLNKQYVGKDFSQGISGSALAPDQVDNAAEHHMPLCMKNLHLNLKHDHKLKHWGRLQYGLFLKGAGLGLDEALLFWESHFTKVMTHEAFTKGYAYSFRHMYGKEGARKNYTPYSCMKIIMGAAPEAGAHHGCPYRHSSDAQLAGLLSGLALGTGVAKEIAAVAKGGDYQLACLKHFEAQHPGYQGMLDQGVLRNESQGIADHPNQWYKMSTQYHRAKQPQPQPGVAALVE